MPDPLGVSFSPAGDPAKQNGSRPSPVQQAIQTLSLHIPQNAGASAFTPQSLLDAPGGSGLGGHPDAILEMLKKLLFGPQQGTQPVPGGGPVGAPPPSRFGTQPLPGGRTMDSGPTVPSAFPMPNVNPGGDSGGRVTTDVPSGDLPGGPLPPTNPAGPSETSFRPPTMAGGRLAGGNDWGRRG